MRLLKFLVSSLLLVSCGSSISAETFDVDEAIEYCTHKVDLTLSQLNRDTTDYTLMPRNIPSTDSVWHLRKAIPEEWCSGFWPGVLWYTYEATGNKKYKEKAQRYTSELEYLANSSAYDHDLGFIMFCSYGNGNRLTGDSGYKDILIASADTLATLYNPNVGTILSWPRNVDMLGGHNTIMDNMMNLEMLFWAARNGNRPYLYDIAVKHAETTMHHHFRPDYSCYHVAVYDPETGNFLKGQTHQGFSDSSMWARGQAWAIYGYTMVYRETLDLRFLDFACKVTDAYLDRLPDDYIPYWDFDDPCIPNAYKDASAAGIVASALLELQDYCAGKRKETYKAAAVKMLESLSGKDYRSGNGRLSFLDHSVGHMPAGSEIDASIIYADYYYLEALLRLRKLNNNKEEIATLPK